MHAAVLLAFTGSKMPPHTHWVHRQRGNTLHRVPRRPDVEVNSNPHAFQLLYDMKKRNVC